MLALGLTMYISVTTMARQTSWLLSMNPLEGTMTPVLPSHDHRPRSRAGPRGVKLATWLLNARNWNSVNSVLEYVPLADLVCGVFEHDSTARISVQD